MNNGVESILAQALQMQPNERATLASRLLASLEPETDWEVELAWQQEAQRRLAELDRSEVTCIPWEQALQQLRGNSRATA
ncbi:MAG: addiction module protein [candidate division KSB1 bacterium]